MCLSPKTIVLVAPTLEQLVLPDLFWSKSTILEDETVTDKYFLFLSQLTCNY